MLSMMDQMLNISMKQFLGLISLSPRIENALLGSPEGLGRALELCSYYEHPDCNALQSDPKSLLLNSASRYFKALLTTGSSLRALGW
jgi:c-di-GMP-related signal transduction protein